MMDCKNHVVTTEGGFICRFEENPMNGDWLAMCFDGSSSFYKKTLVRNSIGKLELGKKLTFSYYGDNCIKKFESSTLIKSIEPVLIARS